MNAQYTPADFNGWQFIPWHTDKMDCEKLLAEHEIEFNAGNPNAKRPVTKLNWNGWETSLNYDNYALYDVQSYKLDFSEEENNEAVELFEQMAGELAEMYGESVETGEDASKKHQWIVFETEYSIINLHVWEVANTKGGPSLLLQENPK